MSHPFSKTGKLTFEELLHQLHVVSEQLPVRRTGDVYFKRSMANRLYVFVGYGLLWLAE